MKTSLPAAYLRFTPWLFLLLITPACVLNAQDEKPVVNQGNDLPFASSLLKPGGIPRVIHYNRSDFQSHPQFWIMCQDEAGILYFGNRDGALAFDAERWHKIYLPNNSSVLSLLHASDGNVYAGGFNEFGVIEKDLGGKYGFRSFMHLLSPEERNMGNISFIHEVQGHVIFLTYNKLIALSRNKAVTIPALNGNFLFSAAVNDKLYVRDEQGVKSVDLESLVIRPEFSMEELGGEELIGMLPGRQGHEVLIVTTRGSIFAFNSETGKVFLWKRLFAEGNGAVITSAIRSSSGLYYFGTLSAQVISMNSTGELVTEKGTYGQLQDNTVLHLFESREGDLWALLNNGIDCIDVSSPVSVLFEKASVFDVLLSGKHLYLATNQGVFVAELSGSRLRFQKVEGLEGLAYSLTSINGQLLCSHERGLFTISGSKARQIEGVKGVWKVIPVRDRPGSYLVCTYSGLFMLVYDSRNGFSLQHKIQGFSESSREILQAAEPGVFWVCHGYKGVYRIKFDVSYSRVVSVEHFKNENGLPSPFNTNVFHWKEDIVFTTNKGIFTYNNRAGVFEPHEFLNGLLGTDANVHKLLTSGNRTWFVQGDEAGYFEMNKALPQLEKRLFLQLKGTFNTGMECIVPLSESGVLIGANNGLYAFDLNYKNAGKVQASVISSVTYSQAGQIERAPLNVPVRAGRSSVAEAGKPNPFTVPVNASGIRFDFTAPGLLSEAGIQYCYLMENMDQSWSDWQRTPFKEYTQLRPGTYTFRVKARSLLGDEASEATYSLKVPPMWYETGWAIAVYFFLLAGIAYTGRKMVGRKITLEKQKTRREEMKKQKVLELEIEQIKLAREKELVEKDKEQLEEDVIYKSKELANYTMLLVKKRELLTEIKDELGTIKSMTTNEMLRGHLKELNRKIGAHLQDEEHILVFESNFERVHHEFFTELKTHFPDLTSKELRLCALVRMNLTNKEIAPILNISIRGVETARYRLRKRLSLGQEESMVEFLEKLSSLVKPELVE